MQLSEYELCIASNLVDPQSMEISWERIGGLDDVVQDIQETVILPFRRADLFRHSKLLQPPKGRLSFLNYSYSFLFCCCCCLCVIRNLVCSKSAFCVIRVSQFVFLLSILYDFSFFFQVCFCMVLRDVERR